MNHFGSGRCRWRWACSGKAIAKGRKAKETKKGRQRQGQRQNKDKQQQNGKRKREISVAQKKRQSFRLLGQVLAQDTELHNVRLLRRKQHPQYVAWRRTTRLGMPRHGTTLCGDVMHGGEARAIGRVLLGKTPRGCMAPAPSKVHGSSPLRLGLTAPLDVGQDVVQGFCVRHLFGARVEALAKVTGAGADKHSRCDVFAECSPRQTLALLHVSFDPHEGGLQLIPCLCGPACKNVIEECASRLLCAVRSRASLAAPPIQVHSHRSPLPPLGMGDMPRPS